MDIRNDVPFPADHALKGHPWRGRGRFPHCLIAVGESYWVEGKDRIAARSMAYKHAVISQKRFIFRREGDGYRCWRTE